MIKYLEDESKAAGAEICLNSIVKQIDWQQGKVKATTPTERFMKPIKY